jgi:hypothetical protein
VDVSGNVLVGQQTASSNAVGTSLRQDGRNFFCADGNYSAHFNRKSSDGAVVHFAKNDEIVGSWMSRGGAVSTIILNPVGAGTGLTASGTQLLPTTGAGALNNGANDLGANGYAFRDLYLSGGVVFGPASATNVSSQTLDSYEEGGWSPAIRGDSSWSAGTQGYTVRTGNYLKVGAFVYLSFDVQVNGLGTVAGNYLQIGNFPFTVQSSNLGGGNVSYYSGVSNTSGPLLLYGTSTGGYLMEGGATYVALSDATNATRLIGTIMYKTAQ